MKAITPFSRLLRDLCEQSGISNDRIGFAVCGYIQALDQYLYAGGVPDTRRMVEIARYFGVPVEGLIEAGHQTRTARPPRSRHTPGRTADLLALAPLPDDVFIAELSHAFETSGFARHTALNEAESARLLAIGGSEITAVWPCANVRYRNERKSA